jgi:hypothetical protein
MPSMECLSMQHCLLESDQPLIQIKCGPADLSFVGWTAKRRRGAVCSGAVPEEWRVQLMSRLHTENHLIERIGWRRGAGRQLRHHLDRKPGSRRGLGRGNPKRRPLDRGPRALAAGAMSMPAGEYVSVGSQSDTEHADLAREKRELADGSRLPVLRGSGRRMPFAPWRCWWWPHRVR